jgi:YVTN family beta-propeller protein
VIFRLLGDLEVVSDDDRVRVAGHKQRALLAVLLLHANEVVSADRLIEDLWGAEPPARAAKGVQVHVWRLRRALASVSGGARGEGRLVTRSSGYLVRVERGELDVAELERLVREGSEALCDGQFERAAGLLCDGLALWRGPPLAEFAYDSFARPEIGRLCELRLQALQARIDADLALARHALLVGELEALVGEHPLAERLRGQLMLALYRSGRQADALEVYRQTRRVWLEDLGLEPGEDLKRLHQGILDHDPGLDLASPAPGRAGEAVDAARENGGPGVARGGRRAPDGGAVRSRVAALIAAIVVLGLIVVTVAAGLFSRAHRGGGMTALANSVAVIDPRDNRTVADTSVGVGPGSITAGPGGVWVANTDDHSISNIDPGSRQVVRTLSFGDTVDGVAGDSRALWTVDSTGGVAARIDPTFTTMVRTVGVGDKPGVGSSPNPLAVGGGAAWVANDASTVVRIADGGTSVSRIDVGNEPSGIAIGEGAIWVADATDGTVSQIDSTGGVSATIPVGPGASGIAVGGGAVWVADTLADALVRVDPTTDSVRTMIAVGSRPRGVAWGDGSVWVANSGDGTVSRVDPRTDRVTATIRVGQSPQALVATAGAVWVSVAASPPIRAAPASPPGVLRVAREVPFSSPDPALNGSNFDLQAQQLYYATCAGLLTYPDRPAPEGTRLVPDVARALPIVSADGRTYTFIVRPGFRFSPPSDAPVTAGTFKHTIERTLGPKLGAYARSYMGDIVGIRAYQAGRTAHLAGVSASGDRLQIRLTAPSPDLPARIATLPFCASPDDAPATAQHEPIPSAGPYYIVPSTPDQLVLARNPNYRGRRPRIPKQIVFSFGVALPRAAKQVASGQSDYLNSEWFGDNPAAAPVLQALERRYGPASAAARTGHQRYFINPWLDLEYLVFNTARPLFASARLRRAVNYAIDRRSLVQHHFPFNGGGASDHYLPPGIPGSGLADIYPLGGPDLAKARSLAAGVRAHATMYTCSWAVQCTEDAQIVQTDLAGIGISLDVKPLPGAEMLRRMARRGEPWDIAFTNWGADFPDPANIINTLFDPASTGNWGRFNDPAFTRRMRRAATLSGDRRIRAYSRLDEDLTRNDPPAAAWGTGTFREFFSARVGCQVYQPIYGFDLGSMCLR